MQTAVAYPMAFGHWQVHRDRLVCRMPRKTVSVQAPGALLREVLALCDGRLAWREVAAQLGLRWDRACVEGFLGQLSQQGAIVEAGEALACWTEIGQLPRLLPQAAPEEEWPLLAQAAEARLLPGPGLQLHDAPRKALALAALLRQRQSRRTFADTALDAAALADILWAAHGVTGTLPGPAPRPRRTVASGGRMHSTRWFVLVLRPLPATEPAAALQPGAYEARFHLEGGCSFERIAGPADAAWDLLQDPRVLTYASALVLPVHDAALPARKYGNRSTLFGAVEAGQSLQNAQLMAEALGAAAVVRGDARADVAMHLLEGCLRDAAHHTPRCVVMPALVLGARALPQQEESADQDAWISLAPATRLGEGGFAFAGQLRVGDAEIRVGGRGPNPRLALLKAEAEAWERRGWGELGACTQARYEELVGAIDPRRLVAYARHQYLRPDFPLAPFDPRAPCLWRRGSDVLAGREVWVLAECVHALSALPPEQRARPYTNTSTSGVAAWTDAEGALCRAATELVERDAFLRAWLARRPPPLTDPGSLPGSARRRVDALAAAGHRVAIAQLGDALMPVHAVFLQSHRRPFTAITAAADFDPEQALAKALDEAEGRAADAAAVPALPLASARQVQSPEDIQRFYCSPRFFRHADFFAAGAASERFAHSRERFCGSWEELKSRFAQRGLQLLAVDLTPPGAAVVQGRLPLHVVRALLPGLLPIWFQHGLHPAAMPAFVHARRAGAGRRCGANLFVHPFT